MQRELGSELACDALALLLCVVRCDAGEAQQLAGRWLLHGFCSAAAAAGQQCSGESRRREDTPPVARMKSV